MSEAQSVITTPEDYNALPNLDVVKSLVDEGYLDPNRAQVWELDGAARKSYLSYFQSVLAPEREDSPQPPTAPNAESAAPPSRDALTQMLLEQSDRGRQVMFQQERVRNRALPNDPGEIMDWPERELEYKWVPYYSDKKPLHPLEQQRLRQMMVKGWTFYDNRYMERRPNANSYPWHPTWEPVESKVMFDGQVLMYRSSKYEQREREEATRKKRDQRNQKKETGKLIDDNTGESYTVQSETGVTTVDKLLREGKNTVDGDAPFANRGAAEAY